MDIKQVMMIKYVLQFSYKHHITFRNIVLQAQSNTKTTKPYYNYSRQS